MKYASVGPIAVWLPEKIETNEDLQREHPRWNLPAVAEKTGILQRHIAAPDECSSDLAVQAAEKLFTDFDIDRNSIDYLLLCTQTPDYPLPTTACLVQDRLHLRKNTGAIDFNLGCSGFVYGLSLADGLIRTGEVKRVLLITSETYSKLIDKDDRSLRTIFGDGAAATLIEASDQQSLSMFEFGTDGSGADTLIAGQGGFRDQANIIPPRHRHRWKSNLYMDGPSLINFTVSAIPGVIEQILDRAELKLEEIDMLLMHQATSKMLSMLQQRIGVSSEKMPIRLEEIGNTVSSTIPILIQGLRDSKELRPDMKSIMLGFGVGWSWAGCLWQDNWQTSQ
ncbi:MAG: ketoacyl-ACP synthase III [Pirellulaceae bacterium]|nr:ketoacyl-ACP synthase III [Pirellulaceae bacterium]